MLPIVSAAVDCFLLQCSFQDAFNQLKDKLLIYLLGGWILELFILADTMKIITDINVIHNEF